ncbi:MAG: amidohydrolase family protein, partial [Nitrososphaerota archaeon]|nr:amidohydrolase family protein [Nitrososphaerota archaeon]
SALPRNHRGEMRRLQCSYLPLCDRKVLYADTISYNAKALRLAAEFLGIERLMFGTDFPFEWGMDSARNSVDGAFEDWEQKLVYSENYHACQKSLAS